ncbi:MAG: protein phosphatase 2C domain-containing protein [Clostridiales bacterium]|jgi:serine/threonine protein phosphatase PrpC|nr:protein phosphatase 2C domain-containing protein [Clostridiales bacterium]
MENYIYGGSSDIGYKRDVNEDYINIIELDDQTLFAIIADGAGSKCSAIQPASIVSSETIQILRRVFASDKDLFLSNAGLFLRESMYTANRVLGAFKLGNEEMYAGFGASVTCCICTVDGKFTFAHCGNTRLYLIRINQKDKVPTIKQITQDHTKARHLVDEGLLTLDHYHTHPDRLVITNSLGVIADPVIQVNSGTLKQNDILLLTSDGIHYALVPEAIMQLVVSSENCDGAATALIEASKIQKYPDNMSAMVLWNRNNR